MKTSSFRQLRIRAGNAAHFAGMPRKYAGVLRNRARRQQPRDQVRNVEASMSGHVFLRRARTRSARSTLIGLTTSRCIFVTVNWAATVELKDQEHSWSAAMYLCVFKLFSHTEAERFFNGSTINTKILRGSLLNRRWWNSWVRNSKNFQC